MATNHEVGGSSPPGQVFYRCSSTPAFKRIAGFLLNNRGTTGGATFVMTLTSLESIISALNDWSVRYLIVGGLAVAAHGYARVTVDVDIVLELVESNVVNAMNALSSLGYAPSIPVSITDFADPAKRAQWITDKGMVVFSLRSEQHPYTPIDIFVAEPFDFDIEYKRAYVAEIAPEKPTRFVALETLITMKEAAGRTKDQDDVRQLRLLQDNLDDRS